MILLYPRLPHALAATLAGERATMTVEAARAVADNTHPNATYAPTGGMRVQASNLDKLAGSIRALARDCGYPSPRVKGARDHFDGHLGRVLHEDSGLSPSEACRDGVWSFLACVLVPDVVRWRVPGADTSHANFLGKDRGIDNALGRCWWAAHLLREEDSPDDPYALLLELGVDEMVGFARRVRAMVNRRVAATFARIVVTFHEAGPAFARFELMRDAMKRFLRLASFASFESLTQAELERSLWDLVTASAVAITRDRKIDYAAPERPASVGEIQSAVTEVLAAPEPGGAVELDGDDDDADAQSDLNRQLSRILARIDVDSSGPFRFDQLKVWLGFQLGIPSSRVAIKRLASPKNYRNRIGEGLRPRPELALLLHSGDEAEVIAALNSRLHLCPETTALLCTSHDEGWAVDTIAGLAEAPLVSTLSPMFPAASFVELELEEHLGAELPADIENHIVETVAALPLGELQVVETVGAQINSLLEGIGGHAPTKRIVDQKNVGNRISESLGRGASVHVFGTTVELLETTRRIAEEQSLGTKVRLIIILVEDEDGSLASAPVIMRNSGGQVEEVEIEVEADEVEAGLSPDAIQAYPSVDADDELDELDDSSSEPGFFELESLEERAILVAQQLLFHGALTKSEAIRAAAEGLRDAGRLSYQRLRTHGRVYTAVLDAIEMGVRTGYFDRPRRGEVRALLDSAEDYSREDWLEVVERALPSGEAATRHDAVRIAAAWARDNLGLEYMRIRGNGKIDRGIRNAFRTLIRRDRMEIVSREEIMLLDGD
ncbi:hypothetical protein ENSA5_44900 [Enhygromyxa salina]|uniref:Uncharacterized protein n=1 Tax=Enhygromyxa salina TaxID=215803 RepID=A0A2S9XKF3_9BACT|nr:DUF6339 family protein [Enhygromyxa salina]PRP93151.1 hypothetical protein ENSA5_44900 [Enhygromyxa salina]